MRGLLLDVEHDEVKIVEVNELEDYYRLMGCDTIEINVRKIGGRNFDIICDEEGLFQAEPTVSAVDSQGMTMFVGSLIICGEADTDGKERSLTDEDIVHIRKCILRFPSIKNPMPHHLLCFVEY